MVIPIVVLLMIAALTLIAICCVWVSVGELREDRVNRARVRRRIGQAEYQLHRKASETFNNMMRVARDVGDHSPEGRQRHQ